MSLGNFPQPCLPEGISSTQKIKIVKSRFYLGVFSDFENGLKRDKIKERIFILSLIFLPSRDIFSHL
jgi:hypothetical protein